MVYYLAFDRGNFRSNDRYVKIENAKIHRNLDVNNNLRALCTFTSKFAKEEELKEALLKLDPKLSKYKHFNLTIIWKRKYKGRDYIRSNAVPYAINAKYFNLEFLAKAIASNVYKPFFNEFLSSYSICSYLSNEIGELYAAVIEGKSMYVIEDSISAFLKKELYSKGNLSFSKLYKMVMLVSKLLECDTEKSNFKQNEDISSQFSITSLTETEMFQLEWLKTRARLREKNGGYY